MDKMLFKFFTGCCILCSAAATYSIVAVDLENNLMGAAATICIKSEGISLYDALYYSVPSNEANGTGSILLAQGLLGQPSDMHTILALELMKSGADPVSILAKTTDPAIDNGEAYGVPDVGIRQYGLVNTRGEAASYTGPNMDAFYMQYFGIESTQEDFQSTTASHAFAVQGNIVDSAVVSTVADAFEGRDLAEALFNALTSTSNKNIGDARCANDGVAGSIAFLHVENANNGETSLHIDIRYELDGLKVADPFYSLQKQYEAWRSDPTLGATPGPTSGTNTVPTIRIPVFVTSLGVISCLLH